MTFVVATLAGCGASLPAPPKGPVPTDGMIEVPYPPPAARVETIPPHDSTGEVWIDGQWQWDGSDWRWLPGAWTSPPKDAYFTPWTTRRDRDGRLLFAPAAWRSKDGKAIGAFGQENCPKEGKAP